MSELESEVMAYQGRKAKRAGSEARRREILEATLRVIVRDGIRAVRHRSVAKEANVPLSATTYYFRDIQELISDAFTLFTEKAKKNSVEVIHQAAVAAIGDYPQEHYGSNSVRADIASNLAGLLSDYLVIRGTEQRESLIIMQALRQAAMLDERMQQMYDSYMQTVFEVIHEGCLLLETAEPKSDAMLLHSVLQYLENKVMLVKAEDVVSDRQLYFQMLSRHLNLALGVQL